MMHSLHYGIICMREAERVLICLKTTISNTLVIVHKKLFETYHKASYKKAGETYGCNRSNLKQKTKFTSIKTFQS